MSTNNSGRCSPNLRESMEAPSLTTPAGSSIHPAETQLTKPSESRQTRSNSPGKLPTELTLKYQTQVNRLSCLEQIAQTVSADPEKTTLIDIKLNLEHVEEMHKAFAEEHTHFELTWPAAFLDHPYFKDNLHQKEARIYRAVKLVLGKARHALTGAPESPADHSSHSRFESKLPDITLPKFSGEYSSWPGFKELFKCLILDNQRLSTIERLQYLRSCVNDAPGKLIANFPLTGSSLQPSWELLTARYENKRLLIQAQLDQLSDLKPLTQRSAVGLTKLISTVSEARKALESLGVTHNLGDCILVHHVSRQLDRVTREAWETSLGASLEFPKFVQIETFLNTRARALERIESSPITTQPSSSQSSKLQHSRKVTAHQSTTQSEQLSKYHCDCCDGNHFIVVCPKFRDLDVMARRKLASSNRLCYNCLGRHSAIACKSTKNCKHCSARHHTMLHDMGVHGATHQSYSSKKNSSDLANSLASTSAASQ